MAATAALWLAFDVAGGWPRFGSAFVMTVTARVLTVMLFASLRGAGKQSVKPAARAAWPACNGRSPRPPQRPGVMHDSHLQLQELPASLG